MTAIVSDFFSGRTSSSFFNSTTDSAAALRSSSLSCSLFSSVSGAFSGIPESTPALTSLRTALTRSSSLFMGTLFAVTACVSAEPRHLDGPGISRSMSMLDFLSYGTSRP